MWIMLGMLAVFYAIVDRDSVCDPTEDSTDVRRVRRRRSQLRPVVRRDELRQLVVARARRSSPSSGWPPAPGVFGLYGLAYSTPGRRR